MFRCVPLEFFHDYASRVELIGALNQVIHNSREKIVTTRRRCVEVHRERNALRVGEYDLYEKFSFFARQQFVHAARRLQVVLT